MTNTKKTPAARQNTDFYQEITFKLTTLLNKEIIVADFFEEAAGIMTDNKAFGKSIGLFASIDLKSAVKRFSRNLTESEEDEIASKCSDTKNIISENLFLMPLDLAEAQGFLGAVPKGKFLFSSRDFNLLRTFAELMRCKFAMCRKDMIISAENDTNDSAENLEKFFSAFPNLPPEMYSKTVLDEVNRITKCGASYACLFDKKGNIFSETVSAVNETRKKAIKEAAHASILSILDKKAGFNCQSKGTLKSCVSAPVFYSGKITGLLMIAYPEQSFGPRISRILNRMARLYSLLMTHKIELRKNAIKNAENTSILSTTWDLIFTLNTEGQITYISPSVEKMGYSVEEVEGHNFREFVPEEDIPRINSKLEQVLSTGKTSPVFTYRILKKDGTVLLTQLKIVLNKIDGVPVSISAILRDISGEIRTMRELHETQLLSEAIFSKSPLAICLADAFSFSIIKANKNAMKLVGLSKDDNSNKNLISYFPERVQPEIRHILENLIKTSSEMAKDSSTITKRSLIKVHDGREMPAMLSFTYLNAEESQKPALLVIAEDLTMKTRHKEEIGLRLAMLNNSPDYFYAVELSTGKIIFANKSVCSLLGITPKEIYGKLITDVFGSSVLAKKRLEKLRSTARFQEKVSITSRTGEKIELETSATRVRLGGRNIAIVDARDIGSLLDMERELQKTNATLSAILSSMPDHVQLLDSNHALQYENRCLIMATPEEEGNNKSLAHYDPAQKHEKYIDQVIKTGIPISFMEDLRLSKDKYGTFEHRIIPIHDNEGKVSGAGIITRDYTSEREKHEKIMQLEFILKHIFETSKDFMYVMDKNGQYVMINQAAADLFGKKTEEMRGKTNKQLNLPENSVPFKEIKNVFANKNTIFFTRKHTYPKGTIFESIYCSPVFNVANVANYVIVVGRDITKEHNETAQKAISDAKEMVSVTMRPIGHDFNNILTVINGYATLMNEAAKEDTKVKAAIRQILKAVERATKLTAKFQTYARNPIVSHEQDSVSEKKQ